MFTVAHYWVKWTGSNHTFLTLTHIIPFYHPWDPLWSLSLSFSYHAVYESQLLMRSVFSAHLILLDWIAVGILCEECAYVVFYYVILSSCCILFLVYMFPSILCSQGKKQATFICIQNSSLLISVFVERYRKIQDFEFNGNKHFLNLAKLKFTGHAWKRKNKDF